jgi:hypothetical protein
VSADKLKTRQGYPPGVWEDEDGGLHFSLPEIMAHLGVSYNAENEEQMRQIFDEYLRQQLPDAAIVHRTNCPQCGSRGPNHKKNCSYL